MLVQVVPYLNPTILSFSLFLRQTLRLMCKGSISISATLLRKLRDWAAA